MNPDSGMIFMSVRSMCRISIITGIYTLNVDRYGVRGAPSNELNYHTKRKFHFVEQLVQKERCAVHFMVVHIIICHPVRNNITHIFQYLCIQCIANPPIQINSKYGLNRNWVITARLRSAREHLRCAHMWNIIQTNHRQCLSLHNKISYYHNNF